jgi:hypothetical protein
MITPKKAPYSTTSKEPETTIADINKLLKMYGVTNYQWTTMWTEGIVRLKFAIEIEPGKFIPILVEPPQFLAKHRTWDAKKGRNEIVEAPNWPQSIRLLYWWLKLKLEAVAYGLREVQTEFMGDILVKLPGGTETTMAKAMAKELPFSKGTEALQLGQGKPEG